MIEAEISPDLPFHLPMHLSINYSKASIASYSVDVKSLKMLQYSWIFNR